MNKKEYLDSIKNALLENLEGNEITINHLAALLFEMYEKGYKDGSRVGVDKSYAALEPIKDKQVLEGVYEGLKEGRSIGLEEGKALGVKAGKAIGLVEGKAVGLAEGKAVGVKQYKSERAKHAADKRHSMPGGARDKEREVKEAWASGKYESRDICAEQECGGLRWSFKSARNALVGTPEPKNWYAKKKSGKC